MGKFLYGRSQVEKINEELFQNQRAAENSFQFFKKTRPKSRPFPYHPSHKTKAKKSKPTLPKLKFLQKPND